MSKVLIKKLDPSVELPSYKTVGASGMDLMAFIKEPITLKPKSSCLVPTGLSVAFSSDFEIQIDYAPWSVRAILGRPGG